MIHPRKGIPPEVELRTVKEELDLAKKTIVQYTHLVTKLYDELDTLRNVICNTCKAKFVPGAASSSSGGSPGPSPVLLWRKVFGGRPSAQPLHKSGSAQSESTSDPCNAEPSTEVSFEPSLVAPPVPPAPPSITDSTITEPDEANWSVEYNPDIKQTLNVHLAHTLNMKSAVYNLKFSRAGKYLAVGLHTGEVYIYDMKTLSYKILTIVENPAKEQPPIYSMEFSLDDKYIATGGKTGQIRVWNVAERRVLAMFKGHTDGVLTVDFSPDSRFLLSTSLDKSVRIWCMRDGSCKLLLDTEMAYITSAAMSPDSGRYIAAGDYYGVVSIWDFRTRHVVQRWKAGRISQHLWSVQFTSDGKGLLCGGKDRALKYWDISSLLASQSGSTRGEQVGNMEEEMSLTFQGHTASVNSISVFPDSRWVLSGSGDFTARVWDLRTGAWQCILNGHQRSVWAAASPDGQHLATGFRDGLVRIWRYEHAE